MNNRIQELTHQANGNFGDELEFAVVFGEREDFEKFVESVVRECAGIYDKIDNGNAHLGTEDYLEALQKHFGVK